MILNIFYLHRGKNRGKSEAQSSQPSEAVNSIPPYGAAASSIELTAVTVETQRPSRSAGSSAGIAMEGNHSAAGNDVTGAVVNNGTGNDVTGAAVNNGTGNNYINLDVPVSRETQSERSDTNPNPNITSTVQQCFDSSSTVSGTVNSGTVSGTDVAEDVAEDDRHTDEGDEEEGESLRITCCCFCLGVYRET
jgi:hypothetical protein